MRVRVGMGVVVVLGEVGAGSGMRGASCGVGFWSLCSVAVGLGSEGLFSGEEEEKEEGGRNPFDPQQQQQQRNLPRAQLTKHPGFHST